MPRYCFAQLLDIDKLLKCPISRQSGALFFPVNRNPEQPSLGVLFALPFLAIFALFVAIVRRLTAIPSRVHDPTVKKPARADGPSGAHPVLKEKAQPVCRRVGGPGDSGKCDEYQNTDCLGPQLLRQSGLGLSLLRGFRPPVRIARRVPEGPSAVAQLATQCGRCGE